MGGGGEIGSCYDSFHGFRRGVVRDIRVVQDVRATGYQGSKGSMGCKGSSASKGSTRKGAVVGVQ